MEAPIACGLATCQTRICARMTSWSRFTPLVSTFWIRKSETASSSAFCRIACRSFWAMTWPGSWSGSDRACVDSSPATKSMRGRLTGESVHSRSSLQSKKMTWQSSRKHSPWKKRLPSPGRLDRLAGADRKSESATRTKSSHPRRLGWCGHVCHSAGEARRRDGGDDHEHGQRGSRQKPRGRHRDRLQEGRLRTRPPGLRRALAPPGQGDAREISASAETRWTAHFHLRPTRCGVCAKHRRVMGLENDHGCLELRDYSESKAPPRTILVSFHESERRPVDRDNVSHR